MVMHPVGPLPASTYWRRRLVLLAVLVLVVLVLKALLGGGGGDGGNAPKTGAKPSATARPSHTASPRPSPTRAAGPVACRDSALRLTTASDASTYPAGTSPRFTVTVKNVSAVTCRRDLGPLEVVVKSGEDRIWASTDCAPKATSAVQGLGPGGSLETTKTWDGKRSRPGCTGTRTAVRPGTYTVRATIGTLTSTVTVFRVSEAA
jgi:hypothetical protein